MREINAAASTAAASDRNGRKARLHCPAPGQELTAPIAVSLAVHGEFRLQPPDGSHIEREGRIALRLDADITETVLPISDTATTYTHETTATTASIEPGSHRLVAVLVDGANQPWLSSRAEVTFTVVPTCAPEPQDDLPQVVAEKRKAIYCAASDRDFDGLVALASPSIEYTFGNKPTGGFPAFLRSEGSEKNMAGIERILNQEYTFFRGQYVWEESSRSGYRLYIDSTGDWVGYITGD